MLSDKRKISTMLIFSAFCALYYTFTIPSNSIWIDQVRIINVTKEILDGNFPLVGILHSNRMHSFPAFYYFITPLVYISENPLFLYWSVALFYISGVLFVANYIFNKFGYFESNLFLLFSATHVSTLFFSSFFWNPNYIPFFMSLFIVLLFKYLDEKTSVIYFHIVGIIINIIVQMMPQLIVLIPSFIFILFLFRKMPSMVNQVVHVFIQVALVYPWIHFHLFIFEWNNFESAQKLYKGFTIAIIQYINYLGGWGLNSEYTTYLSYGTNTYPYTKLIDILLTGSSIILLILITYSTYLSLRSIKINNYINFHIIETNDYELTTKKCLIVLTVINLSCIWFFLTGIHLMSHHYQFLAPLLALNMSLLVSYEKKYKKLLVSVLMLFILLQGTFSYWRAYSEYKKPYATDIGYSDQFTNYIKKNCNADSAAYILDPRGLHFFQSSKGDLDKKSCGKLILVLRDHYSQSEIIRWLLEKNYAKTDMKFKDYLIWSSNKEL